MGSIKIDQLAEAVTEELSQYRQDVVDHIKASVESAAKDCKKDIQQNSPSRTGSYKKGWRDVKAFESESDIRFQVHNKTDYQLAHLLEHGYAKRNGGRVEGRPHIGPAADRAAKKLIKEAKVAVKK